MLFILYFSMGEKRRNGLLPWITVDSVYGGGVCFIKLSDFRRMLLSERLYTRISNIISIILLY